MKDCFIFSRNTVAGRVRINGTNFHMHILLSTEAIIISRYSLNIPLLSLSSVHIFIRGEMRQDRTELFTIHFIRCYATSGPVILGTEPEAILLHTV
jgi:hypothetical protein